MMADFAKGGIVFGPTPTPGSLDELDRYVFTKQDVEDIALGRAKLEDYD